MDQHAIWSVIPPILALVLAVATRNVLVSLGVGVTLGMIIANGFHPWLGLLDFFERGIMAQLADAANAEMVMIIMVIGGFVHLMDRSGGMAAFARRMTRVVDSPRKAQLSAWVTGMVIFFTDSGNSLILGPMFRPIFAGVRVCREKLAFIIDSTSSPVCVLIPIVGWGVYIMTLVEQSLGSLGVTRSPLEACIGALPFQLYPILALATVPVLVATGREYGPMARVQRRYLEEAAGTEETREAARTDDAGGGEAGAGAVLLPLATLLLALGGLLIYFTVTLGALPGAKVRLSLLMAYLASTAVAAVVLGRRRVFTASRSFELFLEGMGGMVRIVVILLLAWSLGDVCALLGTGETLAGFFDRGLFPGLIPAAVFVLGAVFSLSTGSSWGTFALMMPIALPMAHQAGMPLEVTIAAVLSGGVFGDHCSPVSDTTVLSSMATGCDHASHVNTQLGYAMVTGLSTLVGFVIVGFTGWWFVLVPALALQVTLTLGLTRLRGVPTVGDHAGHALRPGDGPDHR